MNITFNFAKYWFMYTTVQKFGVSMIFLKEINTFQQRHIKLVNRDMYNVT